MLSASLNKTFLSISLSDTYNTIWHLQSPEHSHLEQCRFSRCTALFKAGRKERKKEMFYLTTHSTHIIYGYMASDIWLRTILIVRKETHCHHIGYSYRLAARVLLYAPSHRQDNTYHSLCYTSHGALAGTRNSSMGPRKEGRKCFYLTMHSTHFIYSYMESDIW